MKQRPFSAPNPAALEKFLDPPAPIRLRPPTARTLKELNSLRGEKQKLDLTLKEPVRVDHISKAAPSVQHPSVVAYVNSVIHVMNSALPAPYPEPPKISKKGPPELLINEHFERFMVRPASFERRSLLSLPVLLTLQRTRQRNLAP